MLNGQMNLRASVKVAAAVAGRRHVYPLPLPCEPLCPAPGIFEKQRAFPKLYSHYARVDAAHASSSSADVSPAACFAARFFIFSTNIPAASTSGW